MFSKNKEMFWLGGLYEPTMSYFPKCMFISIFETSVYMSKRKFNGLDAIFYFKDIKSPSQKQFLSCLNILQPLIEN